LPRPRTKKTGHRPCLICQHPDRALIEAAKVTGISGDIVAERYNVSRDSLYRHMRNHVSEEDRASYLSGAPLKELAEKASQEGVSLLGYLSIVRGTLMTQFQLAASLNDRHATATISRALLECLREIGKLTGELLNSSPITSITNNYFAFINSPAFTELQGMLVQALADEPGALQKVLAGLDALEAKASDKKNEPALIEMKPNGGVYAS
jgi:hypothetical protein